MFKPLETFDESITLPVTTAKSYTIASPPMRVGLYLQKVESIVLKQRRGIELSEEEVDQLNLDDDGEKEFYRMLMGPTYDEMLADAVPWPRFQLAANVVYAWITNGRETAEQLWNDAAPKAPAKKAPADRRAKRGVAPLGRQASTAPTTQSQPKSEADTPGATS